MFYCPKCHQFNKDENDASEQHPLMTNNLRDGSGKVIKHVRCDCGNTFAGIVYTGNINEADDPGVFDYYSYIITSYQPDGRFFYSGLGERVNKGYAKYLSKKKPMGE